MVKHELLVVNYKLKAEKRELKFKSGSLNLWITSSIPQVQMHNLRAQPYELQDQIYELRV